jgi:hypothetical protein
VEEPVLDPARLALDRALARAVAARAAAAPWGAPDADAIALRALLADGLDPLAAGALRAVWGRLSARTTVASGAVAMTLAADRWGAALRPVADADVALGAARDGARAVIDIGRADRWWGRLLALPDLRVVAALPDDAAGRPLALVVSAERPGPTGEDRTFWVTDSGETDARIIAALGVAGLAAAPLASAGGLKLFMLAGYVQPEDGRLDGAPGRLSGVIGAAPAF